MNWLFISFLNIFEIVSNTLTGLSFFFMLLLPALDKKVMLDNANYSLSLMSTLFKVLKFV